MFVRPSGAFKDVQALADTLITVNKRTFRLGDIATIKRGYDDPPVTQMRSGGQAVLGIGVTMQPGGDVMQPRQGARREGRRTAGAACRPGSSWLQVSSMPHAVTHSVDEFRRGRSPKRSRSCWS